MAPVGKPTVTQSAGRGPMGTAAPGQFNRSCVCLLRSANHSCSFIAVDGAAKALRIAVVGASQETVPRAAKQRTGPAAPRIGTLYADLGRREAVVARRATAVARQLIAAMAASLAVTQEPQGEVTQRS